MKKALVAYISATGITKDLAEKINNVVKGDLFEIVPEEPYTEQDLDWTDDQSRSSIEMKDKPETRPEIAEKVENMKEYDLIYLGFPIWWYTAPKIINTFLESYDFSGKTIIPYATSGSSQYGDTNEDLKASLKPNTKLLEGKRFSTIASLDDIQEWIDSLDI